MHLLLACLAMILAMQEVPAPAEDRWPPHHVIDEALAAEELARCRATWTDAASWNTRATTIRRHLLDTLGLDLDATRVPVGVTVTGEHAFDDYRVLNLQVETAPGLFIAANLYEPVGRKGPFPAVLCPHGHFRGLDDDPEGRFQHDYQRLCANLARMGAVALTWDMVGWGETTQLPHGVPETTILQTWNSIRMVDWLLSREDIDAARIGMTGSSGGGTQTFLATAVDDRISVSAPVVMVSAHWFGGCACESGLPVHQGKNLHTNNVEFAALAAPRPQLLVSCGGDWTRNTPTVEYPYLHDVYEVLGAGAHCRFVHLPEEQHDYGPGKQAAVHAFMASQLALDTSVEVQDTGITLLTRDQLRAFNSKTPLPPGALGNHEIALEAVQSASNLPGDP